MNKKPIFVALFLAVLLLLSSCSNNVSPDGEKENNDHTLTEEENESPPEPEPFTVYLDNEAGWDMVYCRFYGADDEYLCESELDCDIYGIYYVTIPIECKKYLFTNKQGDFTPLFEAPEGKDLAINNETELWITYFDAIKNSLSVGANYIAVTPALKEMECEYIQFNADKEGIYTFAADDGLDVAIVTVEMGQGNWEADSVDWVTFSTPQNKAFLEPGSYYACVFYSPSLADGVHKIMLSYEEKEEENSSEADPLLNKIFSDGELWFYFYIRDEDAIMTAMCSDGSTCDYTYTLMRENGNFFIHLAPVTEGKDLILDNSRLSTLSYANKIYFEDGVLVVNSRICELKSNS